jgi:hypothetical protein
MILNHRLFEQSFQTLLHDKLQRTNSLTPSERAFIEYVQENGYSTIAPNLHSAPLPRAYQFQKMVGEAEIQYFGIQYYYAFLGVLSVLGGFLCINRSY